ncbi:MAG: hypothetical protein P8J29_09495 [Rhodospirillales bacterium]|nr:hypothetical protein [Rhodospirillales bacterium]
MERGSFEKLILQSGIGPELKNALELVGQNNFAGEPRYSRGVCRELTRTLAGRAYGPVCLEICHLMRLANYCSGQNGYAEFFWGVDFARGSAFQALIENGVQTDTINVCAADVELKYFDGNFRISYSRMPFLNAMVDFIDVFLGNDVIADIARQTADEENGFVKISDITNALSRKLYDALRTQLPTAQVQRKFNSLTSYINNCTPTISSANDIDDDFVLNFWISASDNQSLGDFKTFDSALRSVEIFVLAYEDGLVADALERRKTIGYEHEANEVNPETIAAGDSESSDAENLLFADEADLVSDAFERGATIRHEHGVEKASPDKITPSAGGVGDQILFLDELNTAPQKAVKYLNKRELESLTVITGGERSALAFPISKMRSQIFGKAQAKITHSLRRKRAGKEMIANIEKCIDRDYLDLAREFEQLSFHIDNVYQASFYVLVRARRIAAMEVLLDLNPSFDLVDFLEIKGDLDHVSENVLPAGLTDITEILFTKLMSDQELPKRLSNFLIHSKKSYESISRYGFRSEEIDDERILDGHEKGIAILRKVRTVFQKFTQRVSVIYPNDEALGKYFKEDKAMFMSQFIKLYVDDTK